MSTTLAIHTLANYNPQDTLLTVNKNTGEIGTMSKGTWFKCVVAWWNDVSYDKTTVSSTINALFCTLQQELQPSFETQSIETLERCYHCLTTLNQKFNQNPLLQKTSGLIHTLKTQKECALFSVGERIVFSFPQLEKETFVNSRGEPISLTLPNRQESLSLKQRERPPRSRIGQFDNCTRWQRKVFPQS